MDSGDVSSQVVDELPSVDEVPTSREEDVIVGRLNNGDRIDYVLQVVHRQHYLLTMPRLRLMKSSTRLASLFGHTLATGTNMQLHNMLI